MERNLWKFVHDKYEDLLAIYIEYVKVLGKNLLTQSKLPLGGLFKFLKSLIMILPYQYLGRMKGLRGRSRRLKMIKSLFLY
jgi:hypothetical protein